MAPPTSPVHGPSPTIGTSDSLSPGTLVGGRYRILGCLGRGGMGAVYRAEHTGTEGLVALKVLHAARLVEERHRRRFELEARNAAVLRHTNTARVFDYGVDESVDPPLPYLVMELIEGEPLSSIIARERSLPWPRAIHIARQVLKSLGEAHEHPRHIVHRDVKPANILVTDQLGDRDVVKVIDFGVARALATDELSRERVGSPIAMAPEQWTAGRVGPPTDLYALGCTVYEMLAGRPPFLANDVAELAAMHCSKQPPALPAALAAELPRGLEAWLLALLRKEARRRPASAREALWRLDEAVAGGSARPGEPRPEPVPGTVDRADDGRVRVTLVEQDATDGERTLVSATPFPTTPPSNLPPAFTSFIGRRNELEQLGRLFAEGARLVTVHGAGGTGKTRLIREWGRSQIEACPGGVWFCDLTEAVSPEGVVAGVAAGLGLPLAGHSAIAQIGHSLRHRGSILLLLDNVEQAVEPAAEAVLQWLVAAPDARFLVTSRELLGLPAERVLALTPLPVPKASPSSASVALESDAVALFVDRARATHPAFELTDQDAAAVSELVQQLDGLPLAIELAARRVRVLPPKQMLARLSQRFAFLKARGPSGDRQATLHATIDWSWRLLEPHEQHAFCQCSVFRDGFDREAAEGILDLSMWPGELWAVDVIESLCDKSLLHLDEGADGEPRFGMYVSIQAYAAEKLAQAGAVPGPNGEPLTGPGVGAALAVRHARYYARYGDADFLATTSRDPGALRTLQRELENLLAAWESASSDPASLVLAVRAFRALREVDLRRGPQGFSVRRGLSLAVRTELPDQERASVYIDVAWAAWRAARPDEARRCLGEAEALLGDRATEAMKAALANGWARVQQREGQHEEARRSAELALAAARRAAAGREEIEAIQSLAALARHTGHVPRAVALLEEGLALAERLGEREQQARAHANLGLYHSDVSRLDAARRHLEQSLRLSREMGDRYLQRWAYFYFSLVNAAAGDVDAFFDTARRSLVIARQDGDLLVTANLELNIAEIELQLGRHETVRARLDALREAARDTADKHAAAMGLAVEGQLWLGLEAWAAASEAASELRAVADHYPETFVRAVASATEGRVAYGQGDLPSAAHHLSAAIEILADEGDPRVVAEYAGYLAVVRLELGDLAEARRLVDRAEAGLRAVANPLNLAVALGQRALVDLAEGRRDAAMAGCAEARETVERVGAVLPAEMVVWLARAEAAVRG